MKAIIVGAGGITRELLRRLGDRWEVTVVDLSSERLEGAAALRGVRTLVGDGSSRVVLERAGLADANALIAASNDDAINLEACRLARDAQIRRLVAVAADPESVESYRSLGVPAFSPDALTARRVELGLESRRVSSTAFAGGRAEAIEFRVASDSPVRGKPLKELHAYSWIVGVVLRGEHLIIPHGDTVLETDDLVTVVGAGAEFAEIVRTFTAGDVRFPLDFGKRVAVAAEPAEAALETTLSEAIHLAKNSRASTLTLIHRDPGSIGDEAGADAVRRMIARALELAEGVEVRHRPVRGRPAGHLASLPASESVGVIVAGIPERRNTSHSLRAIALVRRTGRPVLLSRGSHPYRTILVPARPTPSGRAAVRAAIDLARLGNARLRAVAVFDPEFLVGATLPFDPRETIAWIEEEAAVHGVEVEGAVHRGNPVRQILESGMDADLIVLGEHSARGRLSRVLGIGSWIARRARCSVLIVPAHGTG